MSSQPKSPACWPTTSPTGHEAGASVLAADIGGTHARLGQVGTTPDMPLLAYHEYACAGHADLQHIVRDFLDQHADGPITHGVLACPGRVSGGVVHNRNLPWPVVVSALRSDLGMTDLMVINDFEAVAHAVHYTELTTIATLSRTSDAAQPGPQVIVGPGTGLGAAVLLPGHPRPTVLATEAGQVSLSPGTDLEREIMRVLAGSGKTHVSWERVLSGPGLLNLYLALCAIEGVAPALTSPRSVAEAAQSGAHHQAGRALEVFCAMLGSFTGDLALLYGASGGIWLAGGVLPKLREKLIHSTFLDRFTHKGCMSGFLETVPVHLLQHGQLGVTGAAGWYLDQWHRDGKAPDTEKGGGMTI
ncbi:MAG TPA: glucokinase [Oleiagrimonas sp.]|nr:glucokinase [Oleiagrimonas sp.]